VEGQINRVKQMTGSLRLVLLLMLTTALAVGLVILPGCGQKGPLYLPEQPQSQEREDSDS
jgi:predicted small lipoprotein YifL